MARPSTERSENSSSTALGHTQAVSSHGRGPERCGCGAPWGRAHASRPHRFEGRGGVRRRHADTNPQRLDVTAVGLRSKYLGERGHAVLTDPATILAGCDPVGRSWGGCLPIWSHRMRGGERFRLWYCRWGRMSATPNVAAVILARRARWTWAGSRGSPGAHLGSSPPTHWAVGPAGGSGTSAGEVAEHGEDPAVVVFAGG
jgi:hypothetical protein